MTTKMRNVTLLIAALMTIGCGAASPGAGKETVLLKQPCCFGEGGYVSSPVRAGMTTYIAMTTAEIEVSILPRQQEITFDDLFTSDNVPLDFHSAIQYRITDSVKLVASFGADDGPHGMGFFVRTLDKPYQQIVRDAVRKHGLAEMTTVAAEGVDAEITAKFKDLVKRLNVPIDVLGVTLGRANPPKEITNQRIATAAQEQRQKTEQQAKLAEDQRKMHEESRAAADRAYNDKMGISAEQYIHLEQIKMWKETCARGGCTWIVGNIPSMMLGERK